MAEELSYTEYAVLGLLTFGERSGYDLDALAKRTIGFFWRPAKSKIYRVLPRLVERGLAAGSAIAQEKRPDKTVYRITPAGRRALRAWLASPDVIVAPSRHGLLLKLFFGAQGEPEAEIDRDEDFFPYLTLLHGLEDARSTLAWAEDVLRLLARRTARTESAGT